MDSSIYIQTLYSVKRHLEEILKKVVAILESRENGKHAKLITSLDVSAIRTLSGGRD